MLAGLINKPKRRLCLQEPSLAFPNKGMVRFNYQMRPWKQRFQSKHSGIKWIKAHIKAWSAKEVHRASIEYMLRKHNPQKIIILVRDIRHAAVSYRERLRSLYGEVVSPYDRFRLVTLPVANLLIRLSDLPNSRIVHYERFCSDPTERSDLEDWIGFALDGNIKAAFEAEQWKDPAHARMREYKFHEGQITTKSIARRSTLDVVGEQAHAEFAAHLALRYQKFFGYS